MYQLHIGNKNYSSWSLRPWVLMKELNIPFEEVLHIFGEEEDWEAYRQLSPSGLVPCLIDGDTQVWDSLAIAEFLAESHESIWPEDKAARTWARSAASEMHSGFFALREECSMNCGVRVAMKGQSPALKKDIARIDTLWQQGIEKFGGPFLTGDKFTAVDAFYSAVVFRFQTYSISLSETSQKYMEMILKLDSMQSWYQAGLAETSRCQSHEDDVLKAGKIVEDFRAAL